MRKFNDVAFLSGALHLNLFYMIKILSALIAGLLFSVCATAQNMPQDSLQAQPNDFSNRKQVDLLLLQQDIARTKANTIVIIDQKIVSIDDELFRRLDYTKVKKMEVIKDDDSKTTIRNVILITTK